MLATSSPLPGWAPAQHTLEAMKMDSNWIKQAVGVFIAVGVGVGIVIGIVVATVAAALIWWLLPIL